MAEKTEKKPNIFVRAGKGSVKFIRDTKNEIKKIVWPTPKAVFRNMGVVTGDDRGARRIYFRAGCSVYQPAQARDGCGCLIRRKADLGNGLLRRNEECLMNPDGTL